MGIGGLFFLFPFLLLLAWGTVKGFTFRKILSHWGAVSWAKEGISPRYALIEACLIGVFSALAALLLKEGINLLGSYRLRLVSHWGAIAILPVWGLFWGFLAGWLVETFCPSAAGGGIPQIKAAIARPSQVPLSFNVAITKILGTILALGAGLTLGRRAPTVHIGAALAGELTRHVPTSPQHRRQMIAAGAAAGLAAGFNTPLAGIMFVAEELMRDVSNWTLEIAIVASFTGAMVSLLFRSASVKMVSQRAVEVSLGDIPFYLFLGMVAGILGALFNRSVAISSRWYQKLPLPLSVRVSIAACISGIWVAILPPFFLNNAGLTDWLVRGELNTQQIALVFISHYVLTIIAAGSGAPGGLFAPALVMGSSLGYLVGDLEAYISHTSATITFALAGMGAFFTAVVRVPVTAIIMIFELNGDFNLVLPLMICCAVAHYFAETVQKNSPEGYQWQTKSEEEWGGFLLSLTAGEVMQRRVETVTPKTTVVQLLEKMAASHHRGFPVVEGERVVGIVTRSDLEGINADKQEAYVGDIMTKNPLVVETQTSLSDVLYLLNRYGVSRLPVVDNGRLVGIITRSDIIRAEAKQLKGDISRIFSPSYTIYRTRSPVSQVKGCILLVIGSERKWHLRGLGKIAAALAREYNYEIEGLYIIKVPSHQPPRQAQVDSRTPRHSLHLLERMGRKEKIPIHTRLVVAHRRSDVILETVRKKPVNILLMGWQPEGENEVVFCRLVDKLLKYANCKIILVKLGGRKECYPYADGEGEVFVSVGGGPNIKGGLSLIPPLMGVYSGRLPPLWLVRVFCGKENKEEWDYLKQVESRLREKLPQGVIQTLPIIVEEEGEIMPALANTLETHPCQLLIVGASRESLLKRIWASSLPWLLAQKLNTTVIIIALPPKA